MRLLYLASGTLELHRSIISSLLVLGHDVTVIWSLSPDSTSAIRDPMILSQPFDAVLTSNWVGITDGARPINQELARPCPIINLGLGDPFLDLVTLWSHYHNIASAMSAILTDVLGYVA